MVAQALAVAGGLKLVSDLLGSGAAKRGARKAQYIAGQAAREAKEALSPYTTAGAGAAQRLAELYGIAPSKEQRLAKLQEELDFVQTQRRSLLSEPREVSVARIQREMQRVQAEPETAAKSPMDIVSSVPGFQESLQAGTEAIERSAAARGMLGSGNFLADLYGFGQRQFGQQFQSYLSGLERIAGLGLGATGSAVNAQGQAANNMTQAGIAQSQAGIAPLQSTLGFLGTLAGTFGGGRAGGPAPIIDATDTGLDPIRSSGGLLRA